MSTFNPGGPIRPSSAPARMALFLAMAWLLAGALFKLLKGSPADLPPTILQMSPLSVYDTFRGAIAIELCIVALALIWPRLGWMCLTAIYIVFLGLLGKLVAAGAESCGCLGGSIKLAPWVMMAIDGTLLVLLLASRPWKRLPKTRKPMLRVVTLVPIFAVAFLLPWTKFMEVVLPPKVTGNGDNTIVVKGADPAPVKGDFYMFNIEDWEGEFFYDLDLGRLTNPAGGLQTLPAPLHVVLYRKSCEHCRDHISELATNPPDDWPIALVRIPEIDDENAVDVIELKPDGHFALELMPLERGYGITTPSSFDVDEGFMVTNVKEVELE
ncbi:MAG: hypothetical protein JKY61_06010 [Planctomycetes bacterium]|nr:hypothetical protein [Planctomycetota bacterium]